jgi:hypothetical protein
VKYEAKGVPAGQAEPEVVELWGSALGPSPAPLYRWAFLTNPLGPAEVFLLRALAGDGRRTVGSLSASPRRVEVDGRTLSARLLGGFFVHPSHRTFFPALVLQRAALAWAKKNVGLLYGFPNVSATPLIKKLGFHELARIERRVLVLRHASYVAKRLASKRIPAVFARPLALPFDAFRRFVHPRTTRRAPRGLVFQRFDRIDERFDAVCRARSRAFAGVTIGHRDPHLLQWRFLDRPNEPCSVWGLAERGTGTVRSYAVVHVDGPMAHVRDLAGEDVGTMLHTLLLVGRAVRRQRCAALSFACAAPPSLARGLERAGFKSRAELEAPRLMYGHIGEDIQGDVLSLLSRWYATEADEDQ